MLHEPEERRCDTAILLLSPGIKGRVAPHRLYVRMADCYSTMGFPVLRIDPEGLGDCEGEINEYFTADVYGSLELGRLVNDTIDTMNWMQSNCGTGSFILAGLCGGAITGLLTGARDERVASLLSLGMTCVVSGSNLDSSKYISQGQLLGMRDKYIRKLLDPGSWLRLLSFRTDYKLLLRSFLQPVLRCLPGHRRSDPVRNPETISAPSPGSNLNPHFAPALLTFLKHRKILMIFSGTDRLYWEFQEKFMAVYADALAPRKGNLSIHIIKDANHVLSFPEWQSEMLAISTAWLNTLENPE